MRRVVQEGRAHAGIELVFTPCEEIGLRGAHAFDPAPLAARFGFVYDHTGPVGDVVGSAPSLHRLTATFVGRGAHAGITPETGRSAVIAAARAVSRMPLGRIDADTTANVGTIAGGTATNVIAERCTITAEARSRDEHALTVQLTAMLDALTWAAAECEVDLEAHVEREFDAYRLSERDPQVVMALAVLESLGHAPRLVPSGGGSDVNAFIRNGFPTVNLCNGMADVHTSAESIAVVSLEQMLDVTLGLIDAARAG
jgi:tripeptide aminopeptidase